MSHITSAEDIAKIMSDCTLCPRNCHADRLSGETGYCGQSLQIKGARAALHYWEEPCISGTAGSGTVFFSGCNLKCIFCQNNDIALGKKGKTISLDKLSDIYLRLQEMGANNINLVTPTHFIPQIAYSLNRAKRNGLSIPVVYNSGGYEASESLQYLEGLVDIYMPDMKYYDKELSFAYSRAHDYFEVASRALDTMFRQVGCPTFDTKTGLMKKGIIVRHLVLPGQVKDSKKILRYLHETYGNKIYISIMSQYTPLPQVKDIPELNRKVTVEEYERVLSFADKLGIENGFFQEGDTADESFIPPFNYEGIL